MKHPFAAAFLATLLTGTALARAEDGVIVASSVPELAPGSVVVDSQELVLPDGANATVLLRSGTIIKVKGPFQSTLSTQSGATGTSLVQDLRTAGADVSVLGASRTLAMQNAGRSQHIAIDPQHAGMYCIAPDDTVWLRKTGDGKPLEIRKRGLIREVAFPQNADEIEWPTDVPIEDSTVFETWRDKQPIATIGFRRINSKPSETTWIAETMILGCREQAAPGLRELSQKLNGAD